MSPKDDNKEPSTPPMARRIQQVIPGRPPRPQRPRLKLIKLPLKVVMDNNGRPIMDNRGQFLLEEVPQVPVVPQVPPVPEVAEENEAQVHNHEIRVIPRRLKFR